MPEAIKIERAEGDFARGYDAAAQGESSYFVWLNRGKRCRQTLTLTAKAEALLRELSAVHLKEIRDLAPNSSRSCTA